VRTAFSPSLLVCIIVGQLGGAGAKFVGKRTVTFHLCCRLVHRLLCIVKDTDWASLHLGSNKGGTSIIPIFMRTHSSLTYFQHMSHRQSE
jgi:hypothetical protein